MEKELKFVHITKCAGTSIENLGKDHQKLWGRFDPEYKPWQHTLFSLIKKEIREKYDWFMVVRNPFARILSEYYCEWGGIGKKGITHTKEEMNAYLIDKIKNRSPHGHHYTEQHKYYTPEENVVIHMLRFENLKEDFDELMKKYGYPIELSIQTNTKSEKNEVLPFSCDDFSQELNELIQEVYQKDFDFFCDEVREKTNE
jgi:hypothetical protein